MSSILRKILYSARLYQFIVDLIGLQNQKGRQFNNYIEIKETNYHLLTNNKLLENRKLIDISINNATNYEFIIQKKFIQNLLDSLNNQINCYIKICGISLKLELLRKLNRTYIQNILGLFEFSIYQKNNFSLNKFTSEKTLSCIIYPCKFNAEAIAHIKRKTDNSIISVHKSIFYKEPDKTQQLVLKPEDPLSKIPIDLVISWAGHDESSLKTNHNELQTSSTSKSRLSQNDDLKFILRSIQFNAPFINSIFLVVKNKAPDWLNIDHPKISVVEDNELIKTKPKKGLNSHAIEAKLHHIPDLSEHFLYCNDDFFFLSPTTKSDFFIRKNTCKNFPQTSFTTPVFSGNANLIPANLACNNARELMAKKFAHIQSTKYLHAPYSLLKSKMWEVEKLFAQRITETSESGTRSSRDIATTSALFQYYNNYFSYAKESKISSLFINLDTPRLNTSTLKLLLIKKIKILCINENNFTHKQKRKIYKSTQQLLTTLFPFKSEFEK